MAVEWSEERMEDEINHDSFPKATTPAADNIYRISKPELMSALVIITTDTITPLSYHKINHLPKKELPEISFVAKPWRLSPNQTGTN